MVWSLVRAQPCGERGGGREGGREREIIRHYIISLWIVSLLPVCLLSLFSWSHKVSFQVAAWNDDQDCPNRGHHDATAHM